MGCLGNVLWFVFGGAVSGLSWFVPFEYHLADRIRSASCTGTSGVGCSFMCDDYRNPVWFAAV